MPDRVMTVDITESGKWIRYLSHRVSFQAGQSFADFTAVDASGITSPQRSNVLFTSLMRLHVIDVSSDKEYDHKSYTLKQVFQPEIPMLFPSSAVTLTFHNFFASAQTRHILFFYSYVPNVCFSRSRISIFTDILDVVFFMFP